MTNNRYNLRKAPKIKISFFALPFFAFIFISVAHASLVNTSSPIGSGSLSQGLVGWWTFDGADLRTNVVDKSGNGNTGYMKNFTSTSTAVTPGKIGQAMKFDGVNDYVNTSNTTLLNDATQATWSTWINQTAFSNGGFIVDRVNSNNGFYSFSVRIPPSALAIGFDDICMYFAGAVVGYTNTNTIALNKWYHIVFVYDGSQATNATKLKLYINGVATTLQFVGTIPTSIPNTAQPLKFGAETYSSSARLFFNGKIDDTRIYSRTLSASEVKQLYNMGR